MCGLVPLLTQQELGPEQSCRWQLLQWASVGAQAGKVFAFTRPSILCRPQTVRPTTGRRSGGAAGHCPRVRSAYYARVYRHSSLRNGMNIGPKALSEKNRLSALLQAKPALEKVYAEQCEENEGDKDQHQHGRETADHHPDFQHPSRQRALAPALARQHSARARPLRRSITAMSAGLLAHQPIQGGPRRAKRSACREVIITGDQQPGWGGIHGNADWRRWISDAEG